MSYHLNNLYRAIVVTALLLCTVATADAVDLGPVKIHGFVNQMYLKTEKYNYLGDDTTNGSWDNREIGLNLFYRPTNRLYMAGQVIHRDMGTVDVVKEDISLDYLVAGFNAYTDENNTFNLRLGQMRAEQGFFSSALDVPSNRDMVLLPQSIYDDYVRSNYYGIRGLDLTWLHHFESGDWETSYTIGENHFDKELWYHNQIAPYRNANPDLIIYNHSISMGFIPYQQLRTTFYSSDSKWKLGAIYRYYKFHDEIMLDTQYGEYQLYQKVPNSRHILFSVERYWENWTLTIEYQKFKNKIHQALYWTDGVVAPIALSVAERFNDSEMAYLQGRYYINSDWDTFLRYERVKARRPGTNATETWVAGLGWTPVNNLKLRAEYHQKQGTIELSPYDNTGIPYSGKHWSLFGFSISYQF